MSMLRGWGEVDKHVEGMGRGWIKVLKEKERERIGEGCDTNAC